MPARPRRVVDVGGEDDEKWVTEILFFGSDRKRQIQIHRKKKKHISSALILFSLHRSYRLFSPTSLLASFVQHAIDDNDSPNQHRKGCGGVHESASESAIDGHGIVKAGEELDENASRPLVPEHYSQAEKEQSLEQWDAATEDGKTGIFHYHRPQL